MTLEEQERFWKQVAELAKPYETQRGIEGERELLTVMLMYPEGTASDTTVMPTASPSTRNVRIVGATGYNRAELEKILAKGQRLNIEVVGICSFADDVTADLADRAVSHLRIVGKLYASPAVREVLMKKARLADK